MPKGLVLVIEDDEWVARLLSGAIQDAGYDAVVSATAQAGLATARADHPDCILCDIDLPDHDGYWVARSVRAENSRVALTPFLFLSGFDDQEARLEGFSVGADVYMTKPFRVDEVVAQIDALVQMADRLRRRHNSSIQVATEASAIEGDLDQMSIVTVLTVLEMERRTGVVEVIHQKRSATIQIASGCAIEGMIAGARVDPLAALRAMIGWKTGRFSFTPSAERSPPTSHKSIGAFVLEAVRLEDESVRDDLERLIASTRSPPSSTHPTSRELAPPSSADAKPASSRSTSLKPRTGAIEDEEEPAPISVIPISVEEPSSRPKPPPPRAALRPPVPAPHSRPVARANLPHPTPAPAIAGPIKAPPQVPRPATPAAPPRPDKKG
jgi:DNA-binding response OmpR family regulator